MSNLTATVKKKEANVTLSAKMQTRFETEFSYFYKNGITLDNTKANTFVTPHKIAGTAKNKFSDKMTVMGTKNVPVKGIRISRVSQPIEAKDFGTENQIMEPGTLFHYINFDLIHKDSLDILSSLFEIQGGIITWEQFRYFTAKTQVTADNLNNDTVNFANVYEGNTCTCIFDDYLDEDSGITRHVVKFGRSIKGAEAEKAEAIDFTALLALAVA